MTERVRRLIAEHLSSGQVSMDWAGRGLGVSPATLRRYLREENITFSSILSRPSANFTASATSRRSLSASGSRDVELSIAHSSGARDVAYGVHRSKRGGQGETGNGGERGQQGEGGADERASAKGSGWGSGVRRVLGLGL